MWDRGSEYKANEPVEGAAALYWNMQEYTPLPPWRFLLYLLLTCFRHLCLNMCACTSGERSTPHSQICKHGYACVHVDLVMGARRVGGYQFHLAKLSSSHEGSKNREVRGGSSKPRGASKQTARCIWLKWSLVVSSHVDYFCFILPMFRVVWPKIIWYKYYLLRKMGYVFFLM